MVIYACPRILEFFSLTLKESTSKDQSSELVFNDVFDIQDSNLCYALV